ncbi:hypothetical protein GCM10010149_47680 [Nonomuraea roseoviolacea subsp. roseoviolacea]
MAALQPHQVPEVPAALAELAAERALLAAEAVMATEAGAELAAVAGLPVRRPLATRAATLLTALAAVAAQALSLAVALAETVEHKGRPGLRRRPVLAVVAVAMAALIQARATDRPALPDRSGSLTRQ